MLSAFHGIAAILMAVTVCAGYYYCANWLLDRYVILASKKGPSNERINEVRSWLFLLPAWLALFVYLVYPVFGSLWRSMFDRAGDQFVGFDNYLSLLASTSFQVALLNNALWAVVVPAIVTAVGLLIAQLTDNMKLGNMVKSIIFMPMAVSFVGASLIWKFVYANNGEIGILNAFREALGMHAIDFIQIQFWNNLFLMVILIWVQTGFAMVILSAALRNVPAETIEAAVLDGATPVQVFFRIQIPQILGAIIVVWTTVTILVLKVFDIVYTMTGGNFGTQILPSHMMQFVFRDDGRATAVAVMIMLLVTPVVFQNIRLARKGQF